MDGISAELDSLRRRIDSMKVRDARSDEHLVILAELESARDELSQADEELRRQQAELDRVVDNQRLGVWQHDRLLAVLPAAVVVTDALGRINTVNAAAASLLRTRVDQLIRTPVQAFVDDSDRPALRRTLAEAVLSRSDFQVTATLLPRGREPIPAQLLGAVGMDQTTGRVEVNWLILVPRSPDSAQTDAYTTSVRAIVELTQLPLHKQERSEILRQVARICDRALGPGVVLTVTVGEPAAPEVLASTAQDAQIVDGAQVATGEGPCQDAWESGKTVVSEHLHDDSRWPRLVARIKGVEVDGVVSVPVMIGDDVMGVLNIYLEPGRPFDEETADLASLLATAVGAILHEIDSKASLEALAEHLHAAMQSRAPIEQAKGLIMGARGCSAEEAFDILAAMSSRQNVKLRDIALQMIHAASDGASQS
jgi:PAS domain-containing protein